MASPIPEVVKTSEVVRQVIRVAVERGDISSLIAHGYTYWQLSQALKLAISLNYLVEVQGQISVTDQGLALLRQGPDFEREFAMWPRITDRIEKIPLDEPYLPSWRALLAIKERTSS